MTDSGLVQVKSVHIEKLFGLYDHTIQLNLQERVTILHGPNGVGKTVLLRLIASLLRGDWVSVSRVPFRRFEVVLTDGSRLAVEASVRKRTRRYDIPDELSEFPLKVHLVDKRGEKHEELIDPTGKDFKVPSVLAESLPPWLDRRSPNRWTDIRTGERLSFQEILLRYPEVDEIRQLYAKQETGWQARFSSQVQTHIIETQRLLRFGPWGLGLGESDRAMVSTVRENATDLSRRLKGALATYAGLAQNLDQSFPRRLLAGGQSLRPSEIQRQMKELDEKRRSFRVLGLLDDQTPSPVDTAPSETVLVEQAAVLSLWVQDNQQKLATLDDLARRIQLLMNNVNQKFVHKRLQVDLERGFYMVGHDDEPLDLEVLSSGEQHELVLLYDLLFRVKPNTLVLVDEPELSLHLNWQKRFLPELLEIVQTARFDVLVATHSPYIVGDRSDLMVPLGTEIE